MASTNNKKEVAIRHLKDIGFIDEEQYKDIIDIILCNKAIVGTKVTKLIIDDNECPAGEIIFKKK